MSNQKRIYGVVGYPVKHSLSPAMHNAAFRALGLDAEYKLFEVKPEDLESFLRGLDKNNIYGLNVTVPHKEKALKFVSLDTEFSYLEKVGAINTIVNKQGIWKGFNTDIFGFERHLKESIDPANKKVAVLGAGGAARAVSFALAKSGAKEIAIFDIEKQKAKNISSMIKVLFADFVMDSVDSVEQLNIKDKDVLINATPVGLKESDSCLIKDNQLHKDLVVYDLIYNPSETKLLNLAKKSGAKTANGLGMLLYQGMKSFEIWTGKQAPQEVMQKVLLEALQ